LFTEKAKRFGLVNWILLFMILGSLAAGIGYTLVSLILRVFLNRLETKRAKKAR